MFGKDIPINNASILSVFTNRWQLTVGIVLLILLIVSGVIFYIHIIPGTRDVSIHEPFTDAQASSSMDVSEDDIFVDVAGAVSKPNVYMLNHTSRVSDALEKAGGLSPEADSQWVAKNINLAEKLTDGQKIYIPTTSEKTPDNPDVQTNENSISDQTIHINSASKSDLDSLPGIGEVRAQAIIDNRPYGNVDELITRKVIPNSVYQDIIDKIDL